MAQDFAKQRQPQPQAARKPSRSARPPAQVSRLNWFISGFLFGVLCVVGGYLGMLQYQSMHAGSRQAGNGQATPAKLPVFDFGFYHELANAEVAVKVPAEPGPGPTSATVSKVASPVVATTTAAASAAQPDVQAVNYLLQAGSFQDKQEADERRAKITLLNMSADIVPGVVGGRTWYRVQVGPFAGRNAAEDARKQLSASNIDSLPLLMR